ncbi:LPS export ABC transporter permease LptG [Chitinivorax sp. B]|uniref:LPS export ABC transporter permease LptG n=1 Tax=Chitinivorax sp. B TaxID=2502235 RepID=UPI0010FA0C93|nr:LPS export ABC transporter permease LptG [Chitinivorax sp. B]
MNMLSRYLSSEILKGTLLIFTVLLGLFAFFDVINQLDDMGKGNYKLHYVFMFVGLSLPAHVYELFPVAVLIGSLFTLSTLSSNSEYTIIRASGVSTGGVVRYLLPAGLLFALLTFVFGEYVAPPAERAANQLRLQATNSVVAQEFRSGLWVKDDRHFINVRQVLPDNTLRDLRVYSFDDRYNLKSILNAKEGRHQSDGHWQLTGVTETRMFGSQQVSVVRRSESAWSSVLTPNVLSILLVVPEHMPVADLWNYIKHLKENKQKASRYEIALWSKLLYPMVSICMMLLALPFSQTQRRHSNVGLKLFVGIMLGLVFHFVNSLFKHLGLLYDWNPLLSAGFPSLIVILLGAGMLWYQERR